MRAASTRLRASVVRRIADTCTLTVPGARCSAVAISAFVSPWLSRIRISRSRAVRRSKRSTALAYWVYVVETPESSRRRATEGEKNAPRSEERRVGKEGRGGGARER